MLLVGEMIGWQSPSCIHIANQSVALTKQQVGTVAGAVAAAVAYPPSAPLILGGASLGAGLGVIAHVATSFHSNSS